MSNGIGTPASSPLKDTIDANSGRFEFLKQTLTLGLAGIGGVAALFTDPTRVPGDTFSKWSVLCGSIGLGVVVLFAIMGLSAYANLLTATASSDPTMQPRVPFYAKGVRNHARVVIVGLSVTFLGIGAFALNRLFAPSAATPESAVVAAAKFVSTQANLTPDRINFIRMVAENDAFVVTHSVPVTGTEFAVRVSKKNGSVTHASQSKAAP